MDKIEMILDWARKNPWFNTEFVEDLLDKYNQYGRLTGSQEQALDNIIYKCKIK
jgi:hypothetical protein